MKKSIRKTITVSFISIMLLLIAALFVANRYFLPDYYLGRKVKELKVAYNTIDKLVETAGKEGETVTELLSREYGQNIPDSPAVAIFRTLNNRSNIDIVLVEENESAMIATSREGVYQTKKLKYYITNRDAIVNGSLVPLFQPDKAPPSYRSAPNNAQNVEPFRIISVSSSYIIQQNYDQRSETSYLECWGTFSDGKTSFIMSMPVASITESSTIMTRFLAILGSICILAGGVLIYLATGRITRPINQLAGISQRMSELDFSVRYDGNDKNEIGVLGCSMNVLSEKLEKAIADLKTANNRLQSDIDEKTRVDELRKDFIANVSHELKTPISLIEGYAEGLSEGIAEDAESRSYYLGVIMDEAARMNKLVKQLTVLNNMEFGNDKPEMSRFDLAELTRNIEEHHHQQILESSASVQMELPEHAWIWADEFQTEQVITNFLTNAIHHVGGEKRIIIRIEHCGETERLTVYNDGEQIPQEDIERIWEKFFKVDKARTRAYGGSGIGLSIVSTIMKAHHRNYGVQNREKGVEFFAEFETAETVKKAEA